MLLFAKGREMFVKNLAYEASAGSGKTFMLVVRYLSLLFLGAAPSKILALTFTNKAAHEMQERIVQTLEELPSRGELEEIMRVTGLGREELLGKREAILEQFLHANTKIMTIDSFFSQILRKFSLYAGLMPDFTTANSQHEIKLLARFLKEVSVAGKKETLINLSIASNKRLENLFSLLDELYVKQKEFTRISFGRENPFSFEQKVWGEFEALAAIVHKALNASSTAKKSMVAESFEELCAKAWIGRETLEYQTFAKCYTPAMDDHLHAIQEALFGYYRAREQNFFYALFELLGLYKRAKEALFKEDGELSFDDVTVLVHYLLKERIEKEFLYFRLDAQIEHILLDEFQDTSILQYEILRPLIEEILSGEGVTSGGSFFFVGDVKQSIYRFRGGVSALFGEVASQNATQIEPLLVNYRSQKRIIEFVNQTFGGRMAHYAPQKTREEANGGYVAVLESDTLLETVLLQVKEFLAMGADPDDIAVLCATNGDGEEVKELLLLEGIEVVTETTTKLINQRSVQAVIEYLKYLYFGEEIYRHNFFSLIERDVQPLAKVDLCSKKLDEIVRDVLRRYNLFEGDFHLIKFLNALRRYPDIESFLFEYERLDESGAASDLSGVRILTIHKSKGLEYEHVIVLDRMRKAPPARDSIIYEYEGIELKNLYLRTKGREALDRGYARALEKERALALEDTLNALYVAFTRAKENLVVIQKSKDSMFEVLGLQCGSIGELTCKRSQNAVQKGYEPFVYKNLYYGTQSEILAYEEEEEEDLEAIHFGSALHYTLEMLPSFEADGLVHAKEMLRNKFGSLLREEEMEDICRRVAMLLGDERFLELAKGEIFKEKAIKHKNNLRYIDLLVKQEINDPRSLFGEISWNVIDYKSSLNFAKHHKTQVAYYKNAVHAITGERVEGYICYLLQEGIKIVKV